MKEYWRVILGRKHAYAKESYEGNFIGVGFLHNTDLSSNLPDDRHSFNEVLVPYYRKQFPDKKKISAALACGVLHTISKKMQIGDIVICPDGKGNYYAGEITGNYEYHKDKGQPHHRPVKWLSTIRKDEMSEQLRNSCGAQATVISITKHAKEIEDLLSGNKPTNMPTDGVDGESFIREKHLEDFLVQNWKFIDMGKEYNIFEEDGEMVGQQYPTDTGPIDILGVSKDNKTLLVVELKRGRVSDEAVGQCLRYMGYVKEELAEENQSVKGVIIAFEDDKKIQRALSVTSNIELYTYKVNFKLEKKYQSQNT